MKKRATSQGSVYKNNKRQTWEFVVWVTDPDTKTGKRQVRRKGFATRKAAEEALVDLHGVAVQIDIAFKNLRI